MNKKTYKLFFTILFCLFLQQGFSFWQWTKVQALSNGKRFESTSFAINGKGYVTCGVDTNDNCYNDLWEYDPNFNFWTQKANLPASYRRASFGFELNGKGFIGGGIDDAISSVGTIFNQFWMYDPVLNSWTPKANVPISAFRSAGVSCNGKGYMIGGANNSSFSYNNVYEYDPTSNTWLSKTSFPGDATSIGGREAGTATAIGNKIYYGLGKDDSFLQNDWWEFNPTTNTWTKKANYPASGRTGAWSFSINNLAVVGMGSDGGFNSDTWVYNPTTDSWAYTCSFSGGGRRSVASFAINNIGYMGTGKSGSGTKQDFYKLVANVGINELYNNSNLLSVYPNPVYTNTFAIKLETELVNATVSIINLNGQIVESVEIDNSKEIVIDRTNLSAGNYIVSIHNSNQSISTKKIILF